MAGPMVASNGVVAPSAMEGPTTALEITSADVTVPTFLLADGLHARSARSLCSLESTRIILSVPPDDECVFRLKDVQTSRAFEEVAEYLNTIPDTRSRSFTPKLLSRFANSGDVDPTEEKGPAQCRRRLSLSPPIPSIPHPSSPHHTSSLSPTHEVDSPFSWTSARNTLLQLTFDKDYAVTVVDGGRVRGSVPAARSRPALPPLPVIVRGRIDVDLPHQSPPAPYARPPVVPLPVPPTPVFPPTPHPIPIRTSRRTSHHPAFAFAFALPHRTAPAVGSCERAGVIAIAASWAFLDYA
ncbi:hypothetical protein B0H12DRAFT_1240760 [Mycena haematopus]|nr:hypothetical protein B0H12DRAFT_1240760 [Mycena haematopus]